VARELHFVAELAADQRVNRHAELLAHDVEAGKLNCRMQLRTIVVEARRRVADREAQRLQPKDVMAAQIIGEGRELTGGILRAFGGVAPRSAARIFARHAMPFQSIEPRRLYRQIADQIRKLIASGEFPAGARLPPERDLAKQLGVSRPSVREALIALEVEGRVGVRIGSGIYVQGPTE